MAPASGMRIGDADREATAASLREHFAQGRLTHEEFSQRLSAAFAAKTDIDLAKLTDDLPHISDYGPGLHPGRAAGRSRPAGLPPRQRNARSDRTWQQATGSGAHGGSRASFLVGLLAMMTAIAFIVSLFVPFSLFGLAAPKSLVILLAVFTFGRRILRRVFGGGPVRTRRWPF